MKCNCPIRNTVKRRVYESLQRQNKTLDEGLSSWLDKYIDRIAKKVSDKRAARNPEIQSKIKQIKKLDNEISDIIAKMEQV